MKTAHREFPKDYLSGVELVSRGDQKAVVAEDQYGQYLAFVWMDRDRRNFIAMAGSMEPGVPYNRMRWRQINQEENAPPEYVELEVPQPKAAEIYYSTCSMIDRHNRCRQADLGIEIALGTHDWDKRVNLSIFSMIVVDTWLVYKNCTNTAEYQIDFYEYLAEELINNVYDQPIQGRTRSVSRSPPDGIGIGSDGAMIGGGIGPHLTPTRRKRKRKDGTITNYLHQGRCNVCGSKTTMVCSVCRNGWGEEGEPKSFCCASKSGTNCFSTHLQQKHGFTTP